MAACTPAMPAIPADAVATFVNDFKTKGYGIVRGVFSQDEVTSMKQRFDAWYSDCLEKHGAKGGTFVSALVQHKGELWLALLTPSNNRAHRTRLNPNLQVRGNHRVWMGFAPEGRAGDGAFVRGLQWPAYTDPVLDGVRTDPRLYQLLEPLIGPNIKQIINQMHWKLPGSQTQWRYHQDVRARKPDSCFRDLGSSYVQMGIAVERHDRQTGGMEVLPYSQQCGRDLGIEGIAKEMGIDGHGGGATGEQYHDMLRRAGVDPRQLVDLDLRPGDLVAWGPFLVHGGGLNTSADETRAFYINGYVKAENCDRGHTVWQDGQPLPLGPPVLVQMEQYRETEELGGVYFKTDFTGLSDREIEQLRSISTVRD